jgi:shikimate kinase
MVKENIVLSGFMASGKTTVGELLSGMTGLPLVDTDALIEKETGSSIREIFEEQGEANFRRLERGVIERESARKGAVLAVGGGAVLDSRNVNSLKIRGVVYLLDVSPQEVANRTGGDTDRPLLDGGIAGVEALLAGRDAAYRRAADVVVETTGRAALDVARTIAADFESRRGKRPEESFDGRD